MQTKTTNKLWALALSLIMLLTLIPVSAFTFSTTASAAEEEGVYVLNASDLPNVQAKGDMAKAACNKDGIVTAGTKDYFKIHVDENTRFDTNGKDFEDGFSGKQRINFNSGTKTDTFSNSVEFTTTAAATVKVWWVHSKEQRQLVIYNGKGEQAAISPKTTDLADNTMQITKFDLTEAGKYYLGSTPKSNYIFKVEISEQVAKTYTLNASELPNVQAKGDMAKAACNKDGIVTAGNDDFFKIHVDENTRFDTNSKDFEDGFSGKQRINFNSGTKTDTFSNSVEFTTGSAATVKVWWVHSKEQRQVVIYNAKGEQAAISPKTTDLADNTMQITKFDLPEAGKYYLGSTPKSNYIFKVEVTAGAGKVERTPWADVKTPVISSVKLNAEDKGTVDVAVSAVVGNAGGDGVTVYAYDKDGKEAAKKNSLVEGDSQTVNMALDATGKYTFKAALTRDGETDKVSTGVDFSFTLPLAAPTISSATSKGDGKVELIWVPVSEATGYKVYVDGKEVGTSSTEKYMATGLTVGNKYSFTVAATRAGETGTLSAPVSTTATKDSKQTWSFCFYGTSTKAEKNYYEGDLNADGKVKVVSKDGSGKFQEGSNDGLAFYYTAIPTTKNFTLRAKVHVDTWDLSSGQEGFGLMAMDSLPGADVINTHGLFWSNMYRAGAQRFAYKVDPATKEVVYDGTGDKYQMNIGVGVQAKLGMTKDNIDEVYKAAAGKVEFVERPLETLAVDKGLPAGTYCTIGNCTNPKTFKNPAVAELTDFIVEIQRNNTGYFLSYYTPDGKLVNTQKFYDPKALDKLDPDNVYVGFACARRMEATFSDVSLTTIDPKDDKPAEAKPKTKVKTKIDIKSATLANSENYTLMFTSNLRGTAVVSVNGTAAKTVNVTTPDAYNYVDVKVADGANKVSVKFTPDAKQALEPDQVLDSTAAVTKEVEVKLNNYFAAQKNLYVSPKGNKYGNGGTQYPLDIATAVSVAQPGQTIVLMEGTYKIKGGFTIERGMNGTADKQIKMVADPNAKTRPVIDLQKSAGIVAAGNYWYFKGFDITNSGNGTPGFLLAGSNCTLDGINAHTNGDCGIYIRSKGNSADPKELWPKNNLILNCSAYNNADATGENADGFGAKFTVGVGNVFDGCVAYNNCDDGWDLYARGVSIEAVTLKNCVAYGNGHNTDGSIKGNGNGFKLGGENMPAGHKIINCIAFDNDANGITSNSCPDIKVINCTSYNNKAANIALYTGNKSLDTAFEATGVISYKGGTPDDLSPQGKQTVADLQKASNHFDGNGVTDAWFKSVKFSGKVARKANGTIDMQGFLELTDKAPKDAGARMELKESGNVTITPDETLPNPTTGNAAIPVAVGVLTIAGAAMLVVSKKRKK